MQYLLPAVMRFWYNRQSSHHAEKVTGGINMFPQLGAALGGAIRSFKKAAEEESRLTDPKEEEKKAQQERT
jgi:sec-independent protein translocase protein TatA